MFWDISRCQFGGGRAGLKRRPSRYTTTAKYSRNKMGEFIINLPSRTMEDRQVDLTGRLPLFCLHVGEVKIPVQRYTKYSLSHSPVPWTCLYPTSMSGRLVPLEAGSAGYTVGLVPLDLDGRDCKRRMTEEVVCRLAIWLGGSRPRPPMMSARTGLQQLRTAGVSAGRDGYFGGSVTCHFSLFPLKSPSDAAVKLPLTNLWSLFTPHLDFRDTTYKWKDDGSR